MGMATPIYGHNTDSFYYIYTHELEPIQYHAGPHDNAMAPAIYLNKQIDKVAPHKKQRRSKFKRSGRK